MAVLSVILGDPFGEYLAAAVPCIRPINAGRRNEDDLIDVGGSHRLESLEGAAHIEVEEIEGIFLAAIFVDAVPGGDVDDAIAATKYLGQVRSVQNRPLDKHRPRFEMPRGANIQNDRRVTFVEQLGQEGAAEISGPARQKHLPYLSPHLSPRLTACLPHPAPRT